MKVLPLKGFKTMAALRGFYALALGMKMLPNREYEDLQEYMESLSEAEQLRAVKDAACIVELKQDEIEAMASFCTDDNGIPFEAANIKNLSPEQLLDIIAHVSVAIGKIKIHILTDEEKKKLTDFSVGDPRKYSVKNDELSLEKVLNQAYYEAVYPNVVRNI